MSHTYDIVVSILVFLELAPGLRTGVLRLPRAKVSILVFLELAPGQGYEIISPLQEVCFNPCFSGTRARTWEGTAVHDHSGNVSILVFLELAPGRATRKSEVSRMVSFNPCFSGTRARTESS